MQRYTKYSLLTESIARVDRASFGKMLPDREERVARMDTDKPTHTSSSRARAWSVSRDGMTSVNIPPVTTGDTDTRSGPVGQFVIHCSQRIACSPGPILIMPQCGPLTPMRCLSPVRGVSCRSISTLIDYKIDKNASTRSPSKRHRG